MPKRKRKVEEFGFSKKKKKKGTKCSGERDAAFPDEVDVGNVEDMADEGFLAGELQDNFLTKMKPDKLSTVTKEKKVEAERESSVSYSSVSDSELESDESEQEAQYERVPRTTSWERKEDEEHLHYLLPLKESHGRLIQQQPTRLPQKDESDDCVASEGEDERGVSDDISLDVCVEPPRTLTAVELFVRSQELLAEKKEAIQQYVGHLMEDPEGNVGVLKQLRTLCAEREPDIAVEVRKVAMPAFLDVMKDIAPSYHIRELTEAEKAVKVSKDVRKLRHFEQTLVVEYRLFLSLCDETIKASFLKGCGSDKREKKRKRDRNKPVSLLDNGEHLPSSDLECLGELAVECFCKLLACLPHFNFANNIVASIVCLMPSKALQGKVSKLCCVAIETLFKKDSIGQISYEAVRLISNLVKSKGYKTRPAVLRTFLKLRLGDVDKPLAAAGASALSRGSGRRGGKFSKEEGKKGKKDAKKKLSKKEKLRLISEIKLEHDLQETSAVESKKMRTEVQTEILKLVFLTYFRILKRSRHSPLLQPVLEGLAKFAYLINVDFFADLMSTLHSLAETGGLTNKECMLCVSTAFEILSGQGSALTIDPRQFYIQLYSALLQLDSSSTTGDVLLATDCMDKMLKNIRKVPTQRVLGFVKRLSTVVLQLQPEAALAVLAMLKKFIQLVGQCEQVLDVEAMAASGVYHADVPDPDMSFASSTSLWELADLRLHYDPTVASYSKFLTHGAPSHGKQSLPLSLMRRTPEDFLSQCANGVPLKGQKQSTAKFDPMFGAPPPPPHPSSKLTRGLYWYSCKSTIAIASEQQSSATITQ